MPSDKESHIIDLIVQGQLLDKSDLALYDEVKNDPEFLKELSFRKDVQVSLSSYGRKHIKSRLRELDRRKLILRKAWMVVLLIVVLIALFLSYYSMRPEKSDYYALYFEAYPNIVDPITKGSSVKSSPYLEYEKKNYALSMEGLLKDSSAKSYFYRGIIYNLQGEFEAARQAFTYVINLKDRDFKEQAEWYLFLTLYKLNEMEEANVLLKSIASYENHFYADRALEILEG